MKQAQEVIFSRRRIKPCHPDIIFNVNSVKKSSYQKHLAMFLDSKVNFVEHIKDTQKAFNEFKKSGKQYILCLI